MGYLWHSCFWDFLDRKIRYYFRNCTKTFLIQIPKNNFLHFSKFEFQGAQRVDFKGLNGVSVIFTFFEIISVAKKDTVFGIVLVKHSSYKYLKTNFSIFRNSNFKGHIGLNRGYLRHSCFWHFLGHKMRYHFLNCTKTFFIQIHKNQFKHFSKFEFQVAERVELNG